MYLYYAHISRLPPTHTNTRTIIQCCLCQLFVNCSLLCCMFVSCVRVIHVSCVRVIHVSCVRVIHVLFIVSFMCHVFVSNNVIYVSFICFIYMLRLLCHFRVNDISFLLEFLFLLFFIIVYLIFSIFVSLCIF